MTARPSDGGQLDQPAGDEVPTLSANLWPPLWGAAEQAVLRELIVQATRPSTGKTVLATNMAEQAEAKEGWAVAMCNAEAAASRLAQRLGR